LQPASSILVPNRQGDACALGLTRGVLEAQPQMRASRHPCALPSCRAHGCASHLLAHSSCSLRPYRADQFISSNLNRTHQGQIFVPVHWLQTFYIMGLFVSS